MIFSKILPLFLVKHYEMFGIVYKLYGLTKEKIKIVEEEEK